MLHNTLKSDNLLSTKLRLLKRIIRMRGVEVLRLRSLNPNYSKVHGFNNMDIEGDLRDENEVVKTKVVLTLNNMENLSDKGETNMTIFHPTDEFNKGDVLQYSNGMFTYSFRVDNKRYYGERNRLYEYELIHFKTVINNE